LGRWSDTSFVGAPLGRPCPSNREATARKGTVARCPADRSHRGVSALSVGQVGPTSRAGANDSPGLFRSRGTRQVKPAEGVVPGGKVRKPAEANDSGTSGGGEGGCR